MGSHDAPRGQVHPWTDRRQVDAGNGTRIQSLGRTAESQEESMNSSATGMGRRSFVSSAATALTTGLAVDAEAQAQNVNTNSRPSDLKITDLRIANLGPSREPIGNISLIRIDTNQGIYGLGEIYTGSSPTYALFLKSRLLGENPCDVDRLFRKIKQFGGPARQAGGVCGIEMALWDLAGKAYGVPVHQMLGGKFRDRIRCYADTT